MNSQHYITWCINFGICSPNQSSHLFYHTTPQQTNENKLNFHKLKETIKLLTLASFEPLSIFISINSSPESEAELVIVKFQGDIVLSNFHRSNSLKFQSKFGPKPSEWYSYICSIYLCISHPKCCKKEDFTLLRRLLTFHLSRHDHRSGVPRFLHIVCNIVMFLYWAI